MWVNIMGSQHQAENAELDKGKLSPARKKELSSRAFCAKKFPAPDIESWLLKLVCGYPMPACLLHILDIRLLIEREKY